MTAHDYYRLSIAAKSKTEIRCDALDVALTFVDEAEISSAQALVGG